MEMHCLIRSNVGLLQTALVNVPAMTEEEVRQLTAEMPLAGRCQVEGDLDSLSLDENYDGGSFA